MARSCIVVFTVSTLLSLSVLAQEKPAGDPTKPKVTYEEHIRPILREHCFTCHSQETTKGGLKLDSYGDAMKGGSSGEVVLAGDVPSSRLWALVSHMEKPEMPPMQDKLAAAKLDLIQKWIEGGAPENAGSKVVIKKKNSVALATVTVGKPEGPPPMPEKLLKAPVMVTPRPGSITALASSPWAPLIAVAGQKQVVLYHSETNQVLGVLPFPEGIAYSLRFSRNGSLLLAAGGRGGHSAALCSSM